MGEFSWPQSLTTLCLCSIAVSTEDLMPGEPEERGQAEVPGIHAELRHRISWTTHGETACKWLNLSFSIIRHL